MHFLNSSRLFVPKVKVRKIQKEIVYLKSRLNFVESALLWSVSNFALRTMRFLLKIGILYIHEFEIMQSMNNSIKSFNSFSIQSIFKLYCIK